MTTLLRYQEELRGHYCTRCGVDISTRGIRNYPHSGGYMIEGYEEKQWLFVVCSCRYEWSMEKLGIKEII